MKEEIKKEKYLQSFKVPEGYFESNEMELLKISKKNKRGSSKLFQLLAPISIAAALVIGFFTLLPSGDTDTDTVRIDKSISSAIIEDYLHSNYSDLNNWVVLTELISDETIESEEIELLSDIEIPEDIIYELNYDEYIYYENL